MESNRSLEKYEILAIVLSVLLPGAGHVLLGQTVKGLVMLLILAATGGLGWILCAVVALDCYLLARARQNRSVQAWEMFPERERSMA